MPVPSPRSKLLPARGNYADLAANVTELMDGEICYALDQDQYYQKEGSVLVSVGATKAQGILADSALQDAPSDGSEYVRKDGAWAVVTQGSAGATTIDELSDVDTSSAAPTDGQALVWSSADSEWQPGTVSSSGQPTITWTLTANGTTSYLFAGPGFSAPTPNPAITLMRGQTYVFDNVSGSHPFQIKTESGANGVAYDTGVTNNNTIGTVTFVVPMDAPDTLAYECSVHATMAGNIEVLSPAGDSGLADAPLDTKQYGRQDGAWTEIVAGTEEAPSDSKTYARKGEAWVAVGGVAGGIYATEYGPLGDAAVLAMAGTNNGAYATDADAIADGWTKPVLRGSNKWNDGWQGVRNFAYVNMPTSFNDVTWFGKSDPDLDPAKGQRLAFGGGMAVFMEHKIMNTADFLYGYDVPGIESGIHKEAQYIVDEGVDAPYFYPLLMSFGLNEYATQRVYTRTITEGDVEYFVARIQWVDWYETIRNYSAGDMASRGLYPGSSVAFNPYEPYTTWEGNGSLDELPVISDTRLDYYVSSYGYGYDIAINNDNVLSAELWLGNDGSIRMFVGDAGNTVSVVQREYYGSEPGAPRRYNGIFVDGDGIGALAASDGRFDTLADKPLIGSGEQTEDGTANLPLYQWGISISQAAYSNPISLGDLSGVNLDTPAEGQVLAYDATAGEFKNSAVQGANSAGDLSDVTITAIEDGQVLAYDAAASEFKNVAPPAPAALAETGDVQDYNGIASIGTWNEEMIGVPYTPTAIADDSGEWTAYESNGEYYLFIHWEDSSFNDNSALFNAVAANPTDYTIRMRVNGGQTSPAVQITECVEQTGRFRFIWTDPALDTADYNEGGYDSLSSGNPNGNGPYNNSLELEIKLASTPSGPADGEVLTWVSANSRWEPKSAGGGSGTPFNIRAVAYDSEFQEFWPVNRDEQLFADQALGDVVIKSSGDTGPQIAIYTGFDVEGSENGGWYTINLNSLNLGLPPS